MSLVEEKNETIWIKKRVEKYNNTGGAKQNIEFIDFIPTSIKCKWIQLLPIEIVGGSNNPVEYFNTARITISYIKDITTTDCFIKDVAGNYYRIDNMIADMRKTKLTLTLRSQTF